MSAAALLAGLLLAQVPLPQPTASPAPSPFDPSRIDAMSRMAERLRTHVPYLEVTLRKEPGQPLAEETVDGFGIAWGPRRIVCLAHLVEGAAEIRVRGPRGTTTARAILRDLERRVAILETAEPLASIGLQVPPLAPASSHALDAQVFALVGTSLESHVLIGHVLDVGDQEELEGHPRVSLGLTRGMPVFDERARLVGYARAVAWDRDTAMIVTPEHIRAASTATTAARAPKKPTREEPWWVR